MFVILVGGLKPTEGQEHQGVRGGVVHILCSHSNAHSNVKYFCREPCKDSDVLVTSQEIKPKGRYNIKDEGNMFLVTISDLEKNDSGSYRCGIKRIGWDTYQKVVLTVIEDSQHKARPVDLPESFTEEANDETAPPSRKLVYIGTCLGVVVFALIVVVLIFFRHHRNSRGSTSCGKASHTVHTTPLCREEDVQSPVTPSPCQTASQHEGADKGATTQQGWGGGQADNIYSNLDFSAEPRVPPDNLCYSTVSFTRVPPESPVASIANTYSTITYLPSDESSVYSNI